MHYGEIKNYDIANGIGVRVSLFVSGCTNHCEHCFQPETWDFTHGEPFTEKTQEELLQMMKPDYIHGFTLLGGERNTVVFAETETGISRKNCVGVHRFCAGRSYDRRHSSAL